MEQMKSKKERPFHELVVRCDAEHKGLSIFSCDDKLGNWIDPCDDAISWNEFLIYGIPDKTDDEDEINDEEFEDDFSKATEIGRIIGCHIAKSLIVNLGHDPYISCDDEAGDLESMYSVLQEYDDDNLDFSDDIYYIHEFEIKPEYQGFGYESIILLQFPAIIVRALHVFPSLLMYFPQPTGHDKPERDEEAESILLHRLNYRFQKSNKDKRDENILLFPPVRDVPIKEINRFLGRRNPGTTVPDVYRNKDLYKLYKSVGFKEIGKTGWMCKRISSIYTKDGLNHPIK
jgi:hypothetical protein